jgi:cytochrome c biogenesis factor
VTVIGEVALWVALFLAVWGVVGSFGGAAVGRPELVASAVRSIVASAVMTSAASLGLLAALLRHDFSLQYVAAHTTLNTPTLYLITAFWAGPPGAMLSFALALSACSALAVAAGGRADAERLPWAAGALSAVLAFALIAVCFVTNPYDRVAWVPAEGEGLDPRLQTPLAAPYYLATYAGYAAAAVPFGLTVGAVIGRKVDVHWLEAVRRWALVTWGLLTISAAVRMRWTYLEPVAGRLWPTDVASIATVGGWVVGFALLHSFAGRVGAAGPRVVGGLALAIFGFTLAGAAAVPRPPSSPGSSPQTAAQSLLALVGFALVAAGAIRWAVARLPAPTAAASAGARRRSGPLLALYFGLTLVVAGVAATRWWADAAIEVRPGQAAELADPYGRRWRFVSQGVSRDEGMNYLSTGVAVEAWRDARSAGVISAERRQYLDSIQRTTGEPALVPGLRSSLGLDVYVVLGGVRGEVAQLRVGFRPLLALVWVGWLVIAAGAIALGVTSGSTRTGAAWPAGT